MAQPCAERGVLYHVRRNGQGCLARLGVQESLKGLSNISVQETESNLHGPFVISLRSTDFTYWLTDFSKVHKNILYPYKPPVTQTYSSGHQTGPQ